MTETPVVFTCQGQRLLGVIHQAQGDSLKGVLIVVGGPQYRVGSHRQFVLLARHLVAQGVPTMRFDVRGMGDSEGDPHHFLQINEDIRAAIDCFYATCPSLVGVVVWGLCDAASAALFYAYQDNRVKALALLNPWVFTEQGAAKTVLKHYYLRRLHSKDFWRKVFALKFNVVGSARSFCQLIKQSGQDGKAAQVSGRMALVDQGLPLPTRMRECFKRFPGPVLLILSGRDLTAAEFNEAVNSDPEWQGLLRNTRVLRHEFAEADHTFSSAAWRGRVADWTSDWVKSL